MVSMNSCLDVTTVRGHQVVAIRGEIDLAVADEVRDVLEQQVASGGPVQVDCSEIASIDSRGLSSLICARYAASAAAVGFQLLHVSEPMRRVLEAAGVEGLFDLAYRRGIATPGSGSLPAARAPTATPLRAAMHHPTV